MVHKHILFLVSWMILLLNAYGLTAQEEALTERPIIALANSDLYAVSPQDGTARLLVDRDGKLDRDMSYSQSSWERPIRLSSISPDYRYIAYTGPLYAVREPEFEEVYFDLIHSEINDLTAVEIATGKEILVTNQALTLTDAVAAHRVEVYSNPTWSPDGQRLYFEITFVSLRNRVPKHRIEYYDLVSGERHSFADFEGKNGAMGLYAVPEGLIAARFKDGTRNLELSLYSTDGELLTQHSLSMPWSRMNSMLTVMNLVSYEGKLYYGLYLEGETPALFDIVSGEIIALSRENYPTIASRDNPEASLRIIWSDLYGDEKWSAIDGQGNILSWWLDLPAMRPDLGYSVAPSPDGNEVAFITFGNTLDPYPIWITDANEPRDLGFSANEIQWGVHDYTFAPVVPPFMG